MLLLVLGKFSGHFKLFSDIFKWNNSSFIGKKTFVRLIYDENYLLQLYSNYQYYAVDSVVPQ